MRTRLITAVVLAVLSLPLLIIAPLEGSVALAVALALLVGARLLSRVPAPRLLWIAAGVSVALAVVLLAILLLNRPETSADGPVANPLADVIVLVWAFRLAMLTTAAGAVLYLVRLVRALRAAPVAEQER